MKDAMYIKAIGADASATITIDPDAERLTGVVMTRGKEGNLVTLEPVIIEMPCGNSYELSSANLPVDNVPCSCGNETHWFFRWRQPEDDDFVATKFSTDS